MYFPRPEFCKPLIGWSLLTISLLAGLSSKGRREMPYRSTKISSRAFYEVIAQPNIVMVSTNINKTMLATLSTFPCPSR
jgi:hypothetical protein